MVAPELHALVITAPDPLRGELRGLGLAGLVAGAARFRPGPRPQTPTAATKLALRLVAVHYQQLSAEIAELDRHLHRLVAAAAPQLLAFKGVATDMAAALLLAAGDNPQRGRLRPPVWRGADPGLLRQDHARDHPLPQTAPGP
jgi:transposase